ncbi:MAG: hypothetical protein EOP83_25650 [Verrucomicrobiaceae bacterium]|nr:MAG: hypothetical protein EOP83_25650 [Verrucomicrobiaceae bacterium]
MRRISKDQYERLVPAARNTHSTIRQAWGIGEHIYAVGRDPVVIAEMRAWLDEQNIPAYIQIDSAGAFIEFKDVAPAMLFFMRFK